MHKGIAKLKIYFTVSEYQLRNLVCYISLFVNAVSSLSDKWVMFQDFSLNSQLSDWHWEHGQTIWGSGCISCYVSPWIDRLVLFRNLYEHIELSHRYFLKKSKLHLLHHASQTYDIAYTTKHCFDQCIQYVWNIIYSTRAKCKKGRPS
jgi:hypothetical protein